MPTEEHETESEQNLRRITSWMMIVGTAICAAYFFGFLVYHSLFTTYSDNSWFLSVIHKQYAATLGIPLCVVSSICVVLLLKATAGPIEFEALGFKFRGASGPLVLWIFCFLAMIFALKLLWIPQAQ